ncbi:hypothetical protein BDV96DRAFT_265114 [Lophiotrema nucula]|uniref:PCI domain-containing protein n=1 Tax=Lophiotrema nucula TaxID=690887 RepID=A0A6A5YMV1_9PLEO|nr:hypothetical protein BDV96DRAFT_265114 [Lophiotrema nucula]
MAFQSSVLKEFLVEVNKAIQARDGSWLQGLLPLEPEFPESHKPLILELQNRYSYTDNTAEEKLQALVSSAVPETKEEEGFDGNVISPAWSQMITFLVSWMAFVRDVEYFENLLETYYRLSDIQQKVNSALTHPTKGVLILPTLVVYAGVLSRVAIGLDDQPELISHLVTGSEEGVRESLPEKVANVFRQAFITCLNDRNTAMGGIKNGRPDGKKIGIYKMANICLKILFKVQKLDNCQTIFDNIMNNSPPLAIYPAAERVTYLYYLGRFHFARANYYAAQMALQKAFEDCYRNPFNRELSERAKPQRRLILIYLIGTNILLGRFPSNAIYSLDEAAGLRSKFEPITQAIRTGDLEKFRRITNLDLTHETARWLHKYRMFYQINDYCEVYLWRSLVRKVFLHMGKQGETERSAPTLDLNFALAAFHCGERKALMSEGMAQAEGVPGKRHISMIFNDFTPSPKKGYIDPEFEGIEGVKPFDPMPDMLEIESICSSLITQGFLSGFISHASKRFAISGARKAGGWKNGFPNVWDTIKASSDQTCHGWKLDASSGGGGVIRLAGARAAGS